MLYVHETHDVVGGKLEAFAEAVRTVWRPLVEAGGDARLCWYWELAHGTSASYQAITLTAVRDWAAWGRLVARRGEPRWREWDRLAWTLRREVTAKIMLPAPWSPLQAIDLAAPPVSAGGPPAIYLHDTGWPYPGKLEEYVAALGAIYYPQTQASRMLTVVGCLVVAPGTGRHHEVVLLQRLDDWPRFAGLLRHGEQGAPRGGWMEAGLSYRDRWESKLLRCAAWSPMQ
jgi:hypothetical protein